MGRVIRREIVAIRCELRSCSSVERIDPIPIDDPWQSQERELAALLRQGWALVLTPQLRSYCPLHVSRARSCSCRTNPDRVHLCPLHDPEAASLVRLPMHLDPGQSYSSDGVQPVGGSRMSASGGVGLNTRWQPIAVEAVRVGKRLRPLSPEHVSRLRDSFALLGSQLQLQPIVVDAQLRLIDGAHRLEAARQAGWSSISALIVEGADPERLDLIGFEANLVRRNLGPAELESVWRTHYEPLLRERARERRSAAPRGGRNRAVIGNSDNDVPRNPALSISASARAVTGLSLDTLHKVSEIREIAECEDLPEVIRVAARRAMARLSSPRAGVDPLHRRIVELRRSYLQPQGGDGRATRSESEARFMRVAEEVMRLDERFETGYVFELEQLVRASESNRELLRTMRASLARSLAAVVSVECRLEPQPVSALRVVGAEVSRLLSRSSLAHLTSRAPEQPGGS